VTVITYKSKTVQDVLTQIAGLLVLTKILTFLLGKFNEWSFDRKIKKETNEEFRDIFTYSNFKRTIVDNQEMKAKFHEMEAYNQEMKKKMEQLMQRVDDLERFNEDLDGKQKN
jgi:hypothetical protein